MSEKLTEQQKRDLAGRARTLFERAEKATNDDGGTNDDGAASDGEMATESEVIDEWAAQFPDRETFRERLAAVGLDERACRRLAGADRWPADEPLPDWIGDLSAIVEYVLDASADARRRAVDRFDDRAFSDLLSVIAEFALEEVTDEFSESAFAPDALEPATQWLYGRLTNHYVRVLYVEFKTFVAINDEALARADPDDFEDPPTEYYEQFLDRLFDGAFVDLCLEYPVFARCLAVEVHQWIAFVRECARRVAADREALEVRFAGGEELGAVTSLRPLADDTHQGGRAPVRVEFESGTTVVYKPRSVEPGVAFYTILDRLDEHLSLPSFYCPTYLPRDGYGWMEWIDYREPEDEAAVARYYRRAGALVCLANVLEFTDCQLENLLVHGEHPTIVDAETLFHPWVRPTDRNTPDPVGAFSDETVLSSMLLPWGLGDPSALDSETDTIHLSGLGTDGEHAELPSYAGPSIEAANTDVMAVGTRPAEIDKTENVPSLDGTTKRPDEYLDAILEGFETTYRTVRQLHEEGTFLGEIADRDLVEGIENRLVYRSTSTYSSVIDSLCSREPLGDGVRFSAGMERLVTPRFDGRIDDDRLLTMYAAERTALRRLEPPRFECSPTDTEIRYAGSSLGVDVDRSGYERCRRRLDAMGVADRRQQVRLIQACFESRPGVTAGSTDVGSAVEEAGTLTDERLLSAAEELFDDALDAAVDLGDGRRGWAALEPFHTEPGVVVMPIEASLYDGRCGIALTAAALYRVTGEDRYARIATETLEPIVEEIRNATEPPYRLGGMVGIGSVVYALSTVAGLLDTEASGLLDAEAYLDVATDAAALVTDELIEDDDTYDVIRGSAGTLLGLLACHRRSGERQPLDRAVACGQRLLDARVTVDGHRVWRTIDETPLTGFSHGASGIACALVRLSEATGNRVYADAALEALAYENDHYSADRRNWPDLRAEGGERYPDQWCYGRSGIGLGRLDLVDRLADDNPARSRLFEDAERAFAATSATELDELDNVCCGTFGRVEFLLEGQRRLGGRPDDARALAGRCLARRERAGSLSQIGHFEETVNPTFFHGVTGVAYTLLRLCDPEALPCVLLLE